MNLEEIARLAGVSRSTVSRVINGDARVSDASRARVQEVIQTHDYHPNAAARSLASRRSGIIGLLIPREIEWIFTDLFFPQVIKSISSACNAADLNLMLLMESSESDEAAQRLFNRVVGGRYLDGIIVVSNVIEEPLVEMLDRHHFPFVLVGRHPSRDLSWVDVDNRTASRAAVEHLLGHGHHRIGMIAGAPNLIATLDRRDGYHDALLHADLSLDPELDVSGNFTEMGGYAAMRRLLTLPGERPTAVFSASDLMAFGAMRAIEEAGLRIPEDIAIVGFDGVARGAKILPSLTTVSQPVAGLGVEAVAMVQQRIELPGQPPMHRYLPTELTLRESCGCGIAMGDPLRVEEVAARA